MKNKMIETIYFFCYYAYLLGDKEKTSMYYSLLRDEFKVTGTVNSLKPAQLLELKKIKQDLENNTISHNKWIEETYPISPNPVNIKQMELVKRIHTQGIEQLKTLLKDDVNIYSIEHPCGPYGAVDMVYRGLETIYPVEVKRNIGEHDLIGQISKYDLYHRLQLHYKHYDYVQAVTICNSYQPFTLNELKKKGIITLSYSLEDNGINLFLS